MALNFGGLKGLFPFNVIDEVRSSTDKKRNLAEDAEITYTMFTTGGTWALASSGSNMFSEDPTTSANFNVTVNATGTTAGDYYETAFDFGEKVLVKNIMLTVGLQTANVVRDIMIEHSTDNTNWTALTDLTGAQYDAETMKYYIYTGAWLRYFRIRTTRNAATIFQTGDKINIYDLRVTQ